MTPAIIQNVRLEDQDRDQLLQTVRHLLAEAQALSSRIAAVNEIGVAINRTLDLNEILRVVAKQAKWLLDFEHCSVCLSHADRTWTIQTLFGKPLDFDPALVSTTPNVDYVLRSGRSFLTNEETIAPFLYGYASQMIIPLTSEGRVMGTINFAMVSPYVYSQEDLRIAYMLALQLSAAIRNAMNFEELTRKEAEVRQYAEELEALNYELDAYTHTIAHDLKSPLSGIILGLDIIAMRGHGKLEEQVVSDLRLLKDGAKRMGHMIDNLLWLAKLRDVNEAIDKVDVTATAYAALDRFHHTLKEQKIAVEIGDGFPDAMGHPQWIQEVFANLISNAIKYMGEANEHPHITIRGCVQGKMARYEVVDNGVGIAPEDQARLFEAFTRLHTVKVDGLGLGLSIVHRIVTKLGGQVGVESEPGKGSTFWFTLFPVV
jgi:signal transduction histidine kinase